MLKGIWDENKAKQKAPVISLSGLLFKADHDPDGLSPEEEKKLMEMLDAQMSREG